MVNQHAALRTAIVWEEVDQPVQVVLKECEVPLVELDLTGRSTDDVTTGLDEFLRTDRGADRPHRGPADAVDQVRHDTGAILIWTVHHLLMDGWSMPVIVREVAAAYRAGDAADHRACPSVPRLHRLAGQPRTMPRPPGSGPPGLPAYAHLGRSTAAWRPTRAARQRQGRPCLPRPERRTERRTGVGGAHQPGHAERPVPGGLGSAAEPAHRRRRGRLRTMRPAGHRTAGVDGMVGVFINTIPHRMHIDPEASPGNGCAQCNATTSTLYRSNISAWPESSPVPVCRENDAVRQHPGVRELPGENPHFDLGAGNRLEVREVIEDAGYPLIFTAWPASSIRLQLLYDPAKFDDETVNTPPGRFEFLLRSFVDNMDGRIGVVQVCLVDRITAVAGRRWADVGLPRSIAPPGLVPMVDTPVFVVDSTGAPAPIACPAPSCSAPPEHRRDTGRRGWLLADGRSSRSPTRPEAVARSRSTWTTRPAAGGAAVARAAGRKSWPARGRRRCGLPPARRRLAHRGAADRPVAHGLRPQGTGERRAGGQDLGGLRRYWTTAWVALTEVDHLASIASAANPGAPRRAIVRRGQPTRSPDVAGAEPTMDVGQLRVSQPRLRGAHRLRRTRGRPVPRRAHLCVDQFADGPVGRPDPPGRPNAATGPRR